MPKHNIDRIAAVAIAAQDAYNMASVDDIDREDDRFAPTKVRVLEAIHGEPKKEQAGGTEDERRADRLFSAIVKALTVRL
ncbi:MAG TPA: hypothetical protein VGK73_32465 [Polyangiaceae bacterium]